MAAGCDEHLIVVMVERQTYGQELQKLAFAYYAAALVPGRMIKTLIKDYEFK